MVAAPSRRHRPHLRVETDDADDRAEREKEEGALPTRAEPQPPGCAVPTERQAKLRGNSLIPTAGAEGERLGNGR